MARSKSILIRVTDGDKLEIENKSKSLGLSISSYFLMLYKLDTNKDKNNKSVQ